MPVVAAKEGRRQFPGWCRICIAIQRVTDVIWVLFVHAGKRQIREALSRFGVELNCPLGGSTHGEKDENDVQSGFHRLIL
jgi:hypothetical protein